MMKVEPLNSHDKGKIKLEMKQVLVSFFAVGIIVAMVTAAAIIFIHRSENRGTLIGILLVLVASGFAVSVYYEVRHYLSDLKSKLKKVYSAQVTDKAIHTIWGWHGNPGADANAKPKLTTYFLLLDQQKVQVEEEMYSRVEIGESVLLHYATKSNTLLAITKI